MDSLTKNPLRRLTALLFALALAIAQGGALAQQRPAYAFSQQELDQMLAPVALYPDALLSQVLMAASYPLEVVEAARWSKARPGLAGDDAVRAAARENWDPSVKSLLAFPQILDRMDADLQWTQSLGDAFLDQESQVMDTVQDLRHRAQAAGNLRSDERLQVVDSGASLSLQFYNPRVVYVPYYDPMVVYGSWWWASHPPVAWRPWAGYYARPGYARGYYWGSPVGISVGFFFGGFDWPRRQARVVQVNNYYYNSVTVNRTVVVNRAPGVWHHDPDHRRGIAYRSPEARQRFAAADDHGRGNRADAADSHRPDPRPQSRAEARPQSSAEARTGSRPQSRSDWRTEQRDGSRNGVEPRAESRAVAPVTAVAPAAPATRTEQREVRADRSERGNAAQARDDRDSPGPRLRQKPPGEAATRQDMPRAAAQPAQAPAPREAVAPPAAREQAAAPRRERASPAGAGKEARREADAEPRGNTGERTQGPRLREPRSDEKVRHDPPA